MKGKHGYDSSSGMSHGGGKSKKNMPMATDTHTVGTPPAKTWSGAGANVVGSRLNKGGDMKWRGSRKSSMKY